MKAVIAMDSFKGSLTSMEAGKTAAKGIYKVYPSWCRVKVTGPLGQPVDAIYGILSENRTAVMEMSQAAGITLVKREERNPLYTTTYGVGEMIRHAIQKGCRRFLIGIGGSATNDGGIGMLQALGYDFLTSKKKSRCSGCNGIKRTIFYFRHTCAPGIKRMWISHCLWCNKSALRRNRLPPLFKNYFRKQMHLFPEPELQEGLVLHFLHLQMQFSNPAFISYWKQPIWKKLWTRKLPAKI